MTSLTISHCKGKFSNHKVLNTLKKKGSFVIRETDNAASKPRRVQKKKEKSPFKTSTFRDQFI